MPPVVRACSAVTDSKKVDASERREDIVVSKLKVLDVLEIFGSHRPG